MVNQNEKEPISQMGSFFGGWETEVVERGPKNDQSVNRYQMVMLMTVGGTLDVALADIQRQSTESNPSRK